MGEGERGVLHRRGWPWLVVLRGVLSVGDGEEFAAAIRGSGDKESPGEAVMK